jgi:CO/xanthine dehydrogenase FAD-binding subunit
VVNSVVDALSPLGVKHLDMPLTPEKALEAHIRREDGMIPQQFEYSAPKTLDEALGLLAEGAKPLAGGMSLIPMMKLRLTAPEHLVDLGRIKDLSYIREQGGELHIGATATHHDIDSSPLVRGKCPLLAETASHIGDVQVRNMGTIGGSVAHAIRRRIIRLRSRRSKPRLS